MQSLGQHSQLFHNVIQSVYRSNHTGTLKSLVESLRQSLVVTWVAAYDRSYDPS